MAGGSVNPEATYMPVGPPTHSILQSRPALPITTKRPRPDQAERGRKPRSRSPNPEERKVRWCFGSSARVGHTAGMQPAYDFKLALTRVIEPTGGPGVELATHCGKVIVEPRSWPFL
jgi:hypothetical protein